MNVVVSWDDDEKCVAYTKKLSGLMLQVHNRLWHKDGHYRHKWQQVLQSYADAMRHMGLENATAREQCHQLIKRQGLTIDKLVHPLGKM